MYYKASELVCPGTILRVIMEQYNISTGYICDNAGISNQILDDILTGKKLIPHSIAIIVQQICKLEVEFWARINDFYSKRHNIKYIGQEYGYRSLLNTIAYEKDDNNI